MFQILEKHSGKNFQFLLLFLLSGIVCTAQKIVPEPAVKDSTPVVVKKAPLNKYDSAMKAHSPKQAALRSALLPGLGQIYNKKYWKLPIVYGGLGTCAGIFFYNLSNYKNTKFAHKVKYNMRVFHSDSALFTSIKPNLQPIDEGALLFYRNQFRRDIDYSVLVFMILWGLNVVDAAVDAHLKPFDVSPDLTLQLKPGRSELAGTNGISLILSIK